MRGISAFIIVAMLLLITPFLILNYCVSLHMENIGKHISIHLMGMAYTLYENMTTLKARLEVTSRVPYAIIISSIEGAIYYQGDKIAELLHELNRHLRNSFFLPNVRHELSINLLPIECDSLNKLIEDILSHKVINLLVELRFSGNAVVNILKIPFSTTTFITVPVDYDMLNLPEIGEIKQVDLYENNITFYVSIYNRMPNLVFTILNGTFKIISFDKVIGYGVLSKATIGGGREYLYKIFMHKNTVELGEAIVKAYSMRVFPLTFIANVSAQVGSLTVNFRIEKEELLPFNVTYFKPIVNILDAHYLSEQEYVIKVRVASMLRKGVFNILTNAILRKLKFTIYDGEIRVANVSLIEPTILSFKHMGRDFTAVLLLRAQALVNMTWYSQQLLSRVGQNKTVSYLIKDVQATVYVAGMTLSINLDELNYTTAGGIWYEIVSTGVITPPYRGEMPEYVIAFAKMRVYNYMDYRIKFTGIYGKVYDEKGAFLVEIDQRLNVIVDPHSSKEFTVTIMINRTLMEYVKQNYKRGNDIEMTVIIRDILIEGYWYNVPFSIPFGMLTLIIYIPNAPF